MSETITWVRENLTLLIALTAVLSLCATVIADNLDDRALEKVNTDHGAKFSEHRTMIEVNSRNIAILAETVKQQNIAQERALTRFEKALTRFEDKLDAN